MRRWLGGLLVFALASACGNIQTETPDDNQGPTAVVGSGAISGITQVPTRFDGSASTDPDGFIVAWEWDFGDGNTATGEVVTHIYDAPGDYNAALTVRDNKQETHSVGVGATVEAMDALAGVWTLDPDTGSELCQNSSNSYTVLFPAAALNVTVNGTTITGVANVSGTTLTGQFDTGGELALVGNGGDADATCGTASVDERLNAEFSDAQNFEGQYIIQFTWTDAFCNCSKIFDVTGTR